MDANALTGRLVLSESDWLVHSRSLRLSRRELEIVQFIFDEETAAGMARALGISVHTIHTYLERLYRKLGVQTRCGVVLQVFAEHLRAIRGSGGEQGLPNEGRAPVS